VRGLAPVVASVVVLLAFLPPSSSFAGPWRSGAAGYERAVKEQQTSGAPAFVYFRTEWCGYCKQLDAGPLANRDVQDYLAAFERISINPEDGAKEKAISDRFGVKGYPAVYIVMPGASPQKVATFYGTSKEDAEKFLAAMKNIAGTPKVPEKTTVGKVQGLAPMSATVLASIPQEVIDMQEEGRHGEAIARLTRALEKTRGKEEAPLYFARAISHRAEGKKVDAASDLDEAVRADPDFIEAHVLLCRTYMDLTLWDEALEALESLVEKAPSGESYWLRAYALSKKGRAKESKADYAKACKLGKKEACARK